MSRRWAGRLLLGALMGLVLGCLTAPYLIGNRQAMADDAVSTETGADEDTNPALVFAEGEDQERYSLQTLRKRLTTHKLTFFDPLYKKQKNYAAFALHDLLQLGFADRWKSDKYTDVAFVALDGYQALGSLAAIREAGGYLVYQDLDQEGWEPIGPRKIDPAPYYLVWTGEHQGPKGIYPWPYQLQSIRLVRFEEQYPRVYPQGVSAETDVFQGFQLFRKHCFACHAMNRQGGTVGPDLDAPKNITEYRSEEMIRKYVRAPSQFRYTKMPDNPTLTDEDLDHLLAYLRYMAKRKDRD